MEKTKIVPCCMQNLHGDACNCREKKKEMSVAKLRAELSESIEVTAKQAVDIESLSTELARHKALAEARWQPIATAPDLTCVLCTWDYTWKDSRPHIEPCETGELGEWFFSFDGEICPDNPTHWTPLPESPK